MDTLIELKEKPELNLYASWAYTGSGCEDNWLNLDDFQKNYKKAVNTLNDKHEDYREYDIVERFRLLINNRFQNHDQEFKDVLCNKIYANYWKNYKANCYNLVSFHTNKIKNWSYIFISYIISEQECI